MDHQDHKDHLDLRDLLVSLDSQVSVDLLARPDSSFLAKDLRLDLLDRLEDQAHLESLGVLDHLARTEITDRLGIPANLAHAVSHSYYIFSS